MRFTISRLFAAILIISTALAGCTGSTPAPRQPNAEAGAAPADSPAVPPEPRPEDEVSHLPGHRAPDLVMQDVSTNETIRLSDLRGQVVFLNFWATWCPPCRREMPAMETLQKEMGDRVRVIALGGDYRESPEQLAAFAKDLGLTFTVTYDKAEGFDKYRVMGLPTTLLIDQHGIIRTRHTGALTIEQMREGVAEVERIGREYKPR